MSAVAVSAPSGTNPRVVARPGVSPKAATVAFASFDGLPGSFAQRFSAALVTQAAARDITITDARNAAYLVRGYLDIHADEAGTAVSYVWDVFDRDHRRAQRVADSILLGKANADPWSLVDDRVLQSIASRSADDLAAFLTTTPEAAAGVAMAAPSEAAAAPALAYAPE